MKKTSFFEAHKRWLLCKPTFYDVEYEINPWMHLSDQPDAPVALNQWRALESTLRTIGAEIYLIDQVQGVPDQVFTANGGLVRGKRCALPLFRYPERQKELPYFREWFLQNGFEVMLPTKGTFEGEGDALFQGERLYAGYGFRSELEAYEEIQKFLDFPELVPMKLVDPYFYHLDTCFAPIGPDLALMYLEAFEESTVRAVEKRTEIIPIPEEDARRFSCNCVVLGKTCIIPAGSEQTRKLLEARDFIVHTVELSEFKKAGGAAKCLSLKI